MKEGRKARHVTGDLCWVHLIYFDERLKEPMALVEWIGGRMSLMSPINLTFEN